MSDVRSLVQKLALEQKQQAAVEAKASEFLRISTARLGSGSLGQGELCKGAACVELACMTLGVAVDVPLLARYSGVGDTVYRNAKAALQKILGVTSRATARELCIQFGCARHDQSVRAALAAYKERFVRALPPAQQRHVDFGRPVFLAAAFYLVARRNRVAVDRLKLLGPLGVSAAEFSQTCASMTDLCQDLVGCGPPKRGAEEAAEERRGLIERTGAAADDDVAGSSDEEVEDEGEVGYRINAKKQRKRDYVEWKARVLAKPSSSGQGGTAGGAAGGGGGAGRLTEKKLRQAVLSFGAAGSSGEGAKEAATAAAADGQADGQATAPERQATGSSAGSKRKASAEPAAAKEGGGGSRARKHRAAPTQTAGLAAKNS